jgi:hypothetical protein
MCFPDFAQWESVNVPVNVAGAAKAGVAQRRTTTNNMDTVRFIVELLALLVSSVIWS